MNWLFFKKADVETKDRLKCSQCHIYLPDNYAEDQCEYCLGTKSRVKIQVHKPEPVTTAEPGKCAMCSAVVPGLISRYCMVCSHKAIHYG